eukprot:7872209-Alexandrium_andersonii.AAC.1
MPIGALPTNVPIFLRSVEQAMHDRGFNDYTSPRLHMEINRNGVPHGQRWSLSWQEPRHSL